METRKDISSDEYIVTTFGSIPEAKGSGNRVLSSEVWDGARPLGVGYPFRYVIENHPEGVRIRRLGEAGDKEISEPLRPLSPEELTGDRPIELDGPKPLWLTLQPAGFLHSPWVPKSLPFDAPVDRPGDQVFQRLGLGVGVAALLMMIALWLTPAKPVEEALIPPQYAKILLSPATKTAQTKRSRGDDSKTEVGNVVAAFQSEAVKKTTRTLLDASAAKALISKSTILDASRSKAALKGVFDRKSSLTQKAEKLDFKKLDRGLATKKTTRSSGGYRGNAAKSAASQGGSLVAVANEGVGVADGLTKDEVGKVIRRHLGEIRYCYESALAREPGLEGKLVVSFTVGGQGNVKEVRVKQSSGSSALDQCIGDRLTGWKFPKPRQGVDVGVSYPFIFKSLGS